MTGPSTDIPPELRALAQVLLDRLDPAVRAAAAIATGRTDTPSKCQQVWCPVCALAALVSGEQHPMLDVVAEHGVALLSVMRAVVGTDGAAPPDGPDTPEPEAPPPGRYQHIPIIVEDP